MAIDLTRGKLSEHLPSVRAAIPVWSEFSMSRVRQATRFDLPTSGHIVSHSADDLRSTLRKWDTNHILVLDDTSFSGLSSLIVESLLRQAFPDRQIHFTHGFLILNTGMLGTTPGAKERLRVEGSHAIGGMEMATPRHDGWHFFDMVKQEHLANHLVAVLALIRALRSSNTGKVEALLSDSSTLQALFPNIISSDDLRARQRLGHFVTAHEVNGDLHVRNPQLLPNIIAQGHLLPPEQWRLGERETIEQLILLGELLTKHANQEP